VPLEVLNHQILGKKKTFCQISGGGAHTIGLDIYGHVWSWGDNYNGQLGINVINIKSIQTPLFIEKTSNVILLPFEFLTNFFQAFSGNCIKPLDDFISSLYLFDPDRAVTLKYSPVSFIRKFIGAILGGMVTSV